MGLFRKKIITQVPSAVPELIKTTAADTDYVLIVDDGGNPYKITKPNLLAGLSSGSGDTSGDGGTSGTNAEVKLSGIPFGASPPYSAGREYDKAFDNDLTTIYDFAYPSGGSTGLDLGPTNTKKLTKVRIYPRQDSNVQSRSSGAKIQGSNDQLSGYVDLFTFGSTPDTGTWYEGIVSTSIAYRYLRYYGADNTYCNVSEIVLFGI